MPMHSRSPRMNMRRLLFILVGGVVVVALVGLAIVGVDRSYDAAAPPTPGTTTKPAPPPPVPYGHKAFHVSPSGNDANPGTQAKPWRTIARAMRQTYSAGDQLLFERGGEYFGTIDRIPAPTSRTGG